MPSGKTFDVQHPKLANLERNELLVYSFVSDDPAIDDIWDTISLMLIEYVSFLETPVN